MVRKWYKISYHNPTTQLFVEKIGKKMKGIWKEKSNCQYGRNILRTNPTIFKKKL